MATNKRRICTETYQYFNQNPKGYITGDCMIRAISLASGISYEDVVMGIAKVQCETYRSGDQHYPIYLERIGFIKQPMPKKANGKKYTIDEFCKKIAEPNKSYVVSCAHHLTCVKDKKIHDIWNCGYKCVGNYWEVL